jgi:hypothetical protein
MSMTSLKLCNRGATPGRSKPNTCGKKTNASNPSSPITKPDSIGIKLGKEYCVVAEILPDFSN